MPSRVACSWLVESKDMSDPKRVYCPTIYLVNMISVGSFMTRSAKKYEGLENPSVSQYDPTDTSAAEQSYCTVKADMCP